MKKIITLILGIVAFTYVFAGTALLEQKLPDSDSIFLTTHWKQMGGFERRTPDLLRLGCWSTALAQIVYFHQLQPYGQVNYTSRHGYVIKEDLKNFHVDLRALPSGIDSSTSQQTIDVLAAYNYAAALAVNKDFGTDSYMHKLAPAGLLEAHYRIAASRYISWHGLFPYTHGKQESLIRREIHAKRPLFLHFANLKDFGHSVVIDGYKTVAGHFLVHLNQGQGGPQDGWYDFDKDLLHAGDLNLRVLYTIRPNP